MNAIVHPSQAPAQVEAARAQSIGERSIASKFLYETPRQAELWLKLHEQFTPPADLARTYRQAAEALAAQWPHANGTLIALGCGGGEKDLGVLKTLPANTRFIPTDVSEPLVLKAAKSVADATPLVFDLATAKGLLGFLDQHTGPNRIFTFFGILPNFPPNEILPQLRTLLKPEDRLLLSANLAPNGIKPVLPQYDNAPTREWLAEFPRAHGAGEGEVKITLETDGPLERIAAHFHFTEPCVMSANGEPFDFQPGDVLRLFVSYRYTLQSLTETMTPHDIVIEDTFLSANGEEGVFLCGLQ
jgi:L-histidine N-alpha-methyltransferase